MLKLPGELHGDRSCHQYVVVLRPFDGEIATIEGDCCTTVNQPAPIGGDQGGASTGSACLGQAGTTLPNPKANLISRLDLRKADIHTFREQRVVFDNGSHLLYRRDLRIRNEEHDVRVAHRHTSRLAQHRIINRPNLKFDPPGIKGFGQWDLPPIKAGLAHVDHDQVFTDPGHNEYPGIGLDGRS